MNELQKSVGRAGFSRPRNNRVIAGVCAGVARRFNLDLTLVRVIALLMIPLPVSALLVYVLAWLLMPEDSQTGWWERPRS